MLNEFAFKTEKKVKRMRKNHKITQIGTTN